jgi:hypothetical protein
VDLVATVTTLIPEGVKPLAVWDSTEPGWCDEHWRERTEWAVLHLDAEFTYRAEFYLLDAPFAVFSPLRSEEPATVTGASGPLTARR